MVFHMRGVYGIFHGFPLKFKSHVLISLSTSSCNLIANCQRNNLLLKLNFRLQAIILPPNVPMLKECDAHCIVLKKILLYIPGVRMLLGVKRTAASESGLCSRDASPD